MGSEPAFWKSRFDFIQGRVAFWRRESAFQQSGFEWGQTGLFFGNAGRQFAKAKPQASKAGCIFRTKMRVGFLKNETGGGVACLNCDAAERPRNLKNAANEMGFRRRGQTLRSGSRACITNACGFECFAHFARPAAGLNRRAENHVCNTSVSTRPMLRRERAGMVLANGLFPRCECRFPAGTCRGKTKTKTNKGRPVK